MPAQSILLSKKDLGVMKDRLNSLQRDTTLGWSKENKIQFHISEVGFSKYWNAGGVSAISGILKTNHSLIRKGERSLWSNDLVFRYGGNYQDFDNSEKAQFRKTTDLVRLETTYGLTLSEKSMWYFSAKGTFSTQVSKGYNYKISSDNYISKFFAPGYLFVGAGLEHVHAKQGIKFYLSPITEKSTFVLDERLSESGNFGVRMGRHSHTEVGVLISNYIKKELHKNVVLKHQLNIYSDYLKNFGNIDIDWALNFDLAVTEYLSGSIGSHLIYDDDVKFVAGNENEEAYGARVQLQQSLGFGLKYVF